MNTVSFVGGVSLAILCAASAAAQDWSGKERQITDAATGHILTNANVFSPDGQWIVFDERSDTEGAQFDSPVINRVNVKTGQIETLYTSKNGASVGVVTHNPAENSVVYIHGPENPTKDWSYGGPHRAGMIVKEIDPGVGINLDARDVTPPYTPGALRGGSHVHIYEPDGKWLSFTYQDAVLDALGAAGDHDIDQRNVGISVPGMSVTVDHDSIRNRDGTTFTVLATRTVNTPKPGSDEVNRAYEEGWVGKDGYVKADGTKQRHAVAFLGDTVDSDGKKLTEVFIADLPEDVTVAPADGPLQGTETTRPLPPKGTVQRRLTHTAERKNPGVQGPRFWVRSSPDGTKLAFLMKDDGGVVQIYTVSPNGGDISQVTTNAFDVQSTFTWSPSGNLIAYAGNDGVQITDVASGKTWEVAPGDKDRPVLPLAAVFAPDGNSIAYQRTVKSGNKAWNQIFVTDLSQ